MQSGRRCVEFKPSPQTCLNKLKEFFALKKQHGVIHLPTQPGVYTQFARLLELCSGAMVDIYMEIRRELDELAARYWFIGMDKNHINVSSASEQRVHFIRRE